MISEKQLEDWQRDIDLDPKGFLSWPLCLLAECITEIRRLRAENAELKLNLSLCHDAQLEEGA